MKSSIVIRDDFNNILLVQKKGKKTEPKLWHFLQCEVKGKATPDVAIVKEVSKMLKVTIFDMELSEENGEEYIYSGIIREGIVTHTNISETKWIKKADLKNYDFAEESKEILEYLTK